MVNISINMPEISDIIHAIRYIRFDRRMNASRVQRRNKVKNWISKNKFAGVSCHIWDGELNDINGWMDFITVNSFLVYGELPPKELCQISLPVHTYCKPHQNCCCCFCIQYLHIDKYAYHIRLHTCNYQCIYTSIHHTRKR